MSELYIGLMSGTSVDSIDAVLVDFQTGQPRFLHQLAHPIPPEIKQEIFSLMTPGENEVDRLGVLDYTLGELFADAVQRLLTESGTSAEQVRAIGSHGQTVRHRPPGSLAHAFTLQIGDPNLIAERCGITTIADFRRRDMAAGGQGAPLVPAFHQAFFASDQVSRVILNIGGIANITVLPRSGPVRGYDTGPGNGLMDAWIQRHQGCDYDAEGRWAASGSPNDALVLRLLNHPYFAQSAPKSTGKEMFTIAWLDDVLATAAALPPADVQASLLELSARSIAQEIAQEVKEGSIEVFVCGGGAYNRRLMERLMALLPGYRLATTAKLGIPPDWVEAGAFAWLARQTLARQSGNVPTVTGASRPVILGAVYFA